MAKIKLCFDDKRTSYLRTINSLKGLQERERICESLDRYNNRRKINLLANLSRLTCVEGRPF